MADIKKFVEYLDDLDGVVERLRNDVVNILKSRGWEVEDIGDDDESTLRAFHIEKGYTVTVILNPVTRSIDVRRNNEKGIFTPFAGTAELARWLDTEFEQPFANPSPSSDDESQTLQSSSEDQMS